MTDYETGAHAAAADEHSEPEKQVSDQSAPGSTESVAETDGGASDQTKAQFEESASDEPGSADETELQSLRNEVSAIQGRMALLEKGCNAKLDEIESMVQAGLRQYLGAQLGLEGSTLAERLTALEKKLKHS